MKRSASLFDKVVVVVAGISMKPSSMFDLATRMAMIRESVAEAGMDNVGVNKLNCLLVDYCRRLFERYGTYEEVARRSRLDRRTVRKYVREALGEE